MSHGSTTCERTGAGVGRGAEFIVYVSFCLEGHHVQLSGQGVDCKIFVHHHHQVSGVTSRRRHWRRHLRRRDATDDVTYTSLRRHG